MEETKRSNQPGHADFCTAFAHALPARLEQIRAALQRDDLAGAQAIAHTLSGSAATFDCPGVGTAAAELDRCCRAADRVASRHAFERLCAAAQAEAPDGGPGEVAGPGAPPASAAPLILLVDDDALLLDALARALEAEGFGVCLADNGARALALLQAGQVRPQMAVLDIAMPGMSGLELAARLDGIPYMFLSASSGADIAAQAAECGAVGYLLKPIDPAQLLPAVRAALARAAEIQHLRAAEQRLTLALRDGRETGMAVGLLMERYRIDRHGALRMLRNHARSNQRKLNDVAAELLQAAETLNALTTPKAELPATRTRLPDQRK